MIARVWMARATAPNAITYREHLEQRVLPVLRGLDGYAGATLLGREMAGQVELTVITRWRSLESVRRFAGADLEQAVVADEAIPLLTWWDRRVRHHEILVTEEIRPDR